MATSFLPDARFSVGGSGTLSAEEMAGFQNEVRDMTLTLSARGELIPVVYGRLSIPGLMMTTPTIMSPSGDLLVSFLWGFGEFDAIEQVYINDTVVTNAGGGDTFAITNYLGTSTQDVDPLLQANIAGYNDRCRVPIPGGGYIGVAYSVIRIPAGKLDGFPRVRAVVRGRKVYDPRTLTTAYSANSALCVGDIITNEVFGLNRLALNLAACADWADDLLGDIDGAYRARLALRISQGRKAEEYLDLLCEYAETLYTYEGADIRLFPNAPVDLENVLTLTADDIEGQLSIRGETSSDTPTEIEVQYTEIPVTATNPWATTSLVVSLPGVDAGEIQRIPTSVPYEGVTSALEAANKGNARLARLQNRLVASWTTFDVGVLHQRGDVVKLHLPDYGVENLAVRIMKVSMPEPGRYTVEATRYDPTHYPDAVDLPGEDGLVPVGAIGMLVGTTVPAGWEVYTAANGKYVVGAGGTYAIGDNGVSTVGPWAGSVTGGAHNSSADDMASPIAGATSRAWSRPGTFASTGEHTHTYSVPSVSENVLRRENILVRKITAPSLTIPSSVRCFGLANVTTPATKNSSFSGRLLMPAAANANAGVATQSTTAITLSSVSDAHTHHPNINPGVQSFGGVGVEAVNNVGGGGTHSHTVNVRPTFYPKKKQLCLYEGASDYPARPGNIWMFAYEVLPDDHLLCDGANGTPDMRDRYVEFGSDTAAGPTGGNTMNLGGVSSEVGHSHYGGPMGLPGTANQYGHAGTVYHSHTINQNVAYILKYYALAFIMYTPTE